MKRLFTLTLALLSLTASYAFEPLWLRDIRISPDGSTIAFCYKGDIYTVPVNGGSATRLTTQPSYESNPVWSPDGRTLAFSSDRHGNFDVFTMEVGTRTTRRLTFNSAKEVPLAFTPDGKSVCFSAHIQDPASSALFPSSRMSELYKVPAEGGKTVQMLATPVDELCWSPDGSFFVYQDKKGFEDTFRKHHVSSVTRDIWLCKDGWHTNLTSRPGEDLEPVLSPDSRTVYMISEPADSRDGHPHPEGWQTSLNVYSFPIDNPGELTQISHFSKHPVRSLSIAGDLLCYSWNGGMYTQRIGQEPRKVTVEMTLDQENIPEHKIQSGGAEEAAVSPDGKQIAFILRGDVFVTSTEYTTTRQITSTPCAESSVSFIDDRTLVYASTRSGVNQLYKATISRKEDPNFPNATLIEEKTIFSSPGIDRRLPTISPDGRELAFIEDRNRLMVGDMDSGKVRQITDGSTCSERDGEFCYRWSPDSRWFVLSYVPNGHTPYYDVGLVSAKGGVITNITGSGYMSLSPRFTSDGSAILFTSDRYGMRSHASWGSQRDVFICFLNQAALDNWRLSKEDSELRASPEKANKTRDTASVAKTKKLDIELEGISDRIIRVTPSSGGIADAIMTKDGKNLYYILGGDLWKMDTRTKETKLVSKHCGGGMFSTDASGKTIFLLGQSFRKMEGDNFKSITYSADYHLDRVAERAALFDYVYTEEKERFYDERMHGVDWDFYSDNYRVFLPHIGNNYDFAEMLSEWLGELNVSHTGGRYYPELRTEGTASLGLFYDMQYSGKGLKVDEIVKDGPFDRSEYKLRKGDIITAIDGTEITDERDISILLCGKAGRKTLVEVKGKEAMVVRPISSAAYEELLYKRWVRQRAADVEKWSGGRLGYVHVKSMNDASYRDIYSDILGKYNNCEGIVIDIRFNGGGRLHEDLEVLFSGEKYLTQLVRGQHYCDMPSRRWNKPSIMVTCEADYSNAHGSPWVYRYRQIGKIVGAPVPGTMTSVNWVTLQDPSLIFGIPAVGYMTKDGWYLENDQLNPDILVLNKPEDIVEGEDAQLKAAVEELLREL